VSAQKQPAPPLASEECRKIQGIENVVAETSRRAEQARAALDAATSAVEAAQTKQGTAHAAYAASPNDTTAKAVDESDRALNLAAVRRKAAHTAALEADEALAGAQGALDTAQSELRVSELRTAASTKTFHAEADGHVERFVSLVIELRDTAAKIDAAYGRSVKAAADLRALGVGQANVDPAHVVAVGLERLANERGVIVPDGEWHPLRHTLEKGLAIAPGLGFVVTRIVERLDKAPAPPAVVARFKAQLASVRATQTHGEAEALLARRDDEAHAARQATPEAQAEAAALAERMERSRRPPGPRGWQQ
jgi:hypothetical protein